MEQKTPEFFVVDADKTMIKFPEEPDKFVLHWMRSVQTNGAFSHVLGRTTHSYGEGYNSLKEAVADSPKSVGTVKSVLARFIAMDFGFGSGVDVPELGVVALHGTSDLMKIFASYTDRDGTTKFLKHPDFNKMVQRYE